MPRWRKNVDIDNYYEYKEEEALVIKTTLIITPILAIMFKMPQVALLVLGVVLMHVSLCSIPPFKSIAALSTRVRVVLFFVVSMSSALLLKCRWVVLGLMLYGLWFLYIFYILRKIERADEKLFRQPPKPDDCPICFLPLPLLGPGKRFNHCCGMTICSGCIHAPVYDDEGNEVDNDKCAFCRTPYPTTNEELIELIQKRVEVNDAEAISHLGTHYRNGNFGLPKDCNKALKLWKRAAKLGHVGSYFEIAMAYNGSYGQCVEVNVDKSIHYLELAAIGGDVDARGCLGNSELREPRCPGDTERALKHFTIAVEGGDAGSLREIRQLYSSGQVSKDDYANALSAYQRYLDEIRSTQRDEAAAYSDEYQYYGLHINNPNRIQCL